MTLEEVKKKQVCFGEGDEKHGYSRADNWEAGETKLRHKFWEGATFALAKDTPGCLIATLKGSEVKRVVFVQ